MDGFLSIENFIKSRSAGFMTIDEYVASRTPYLSLNDYAIQRWGIKAKKRRDLLKEEKKEKTNVLEMLEQFGRGVGEMATLGATKYAIPRNDPEGIKESIAKGVGQFVGFLSPLGLVGKAKGIIKGTSEAVKIASSLRNLGLFTKYPKVAKVAGRVADLTTTLSGASALSDIISAPGETMQRAVHGAKLGALFGAAGIVHIPNHPLLGGILRQFGGRALMHVAGEYPIEGRFDVENLAQTVFDEALMTYFLSHGITSKELLEGTKDKHRQKLIDDVYVAVNDVNSHTMAGEKLAITKELLTKPIRQKMNFNDIVRAEEPSKELVNAHKIKFKQGLDVTKDYPITVYWDKEVGKYATRSGVAMLEARRVANIELQAMGKQPTENVTVDIIKPRPGEKLKMRKPWELAVMFGQRKYTPDLSTKLDTTHYWAYETKTGMVRPIVEPATLEVPLVEGKMAGPWKFRHPTFKLSKTEIAFSTGQFDPLKRRWSFVPISKGTEVPTFEWKGKKIFFRGKTDRILDDLNNEKLRLQARFEQAIDPAGKQLIANELAKIDTTASELYKLRIERYNKLDTALFKKGIKPTNIEKIVNRVEQRINTIRKIPDARLPETYSLLLNERLSKLGIGMDMDRFLLSFGIQDKIPRYKHLADIERKFLEMESVPIGNRIGVLFTEFARDSGLLKEPLTGEFATQAKPLQDLWQRRRDALFKTWNWRQKNVVGAGSVLRQLFTMRRWWVLADVRKMFAHLENMSGIPFFGLGKKISRASVFARTETRRITEPLNKFYTMPAEEQAVVAQWFSKAYRGENTIALEAVFNPAQKALKETLQTIMLELEPQIAKYRVLQWIHQVYDPRLAVTAGLKPKFKEPRIFRRQAALEDLLKEAADVYYKSIMPGQAGLFDQWLATRGKNLGVIGEGTYLPEFILSPRKKEFSLSYEEEATYIDVFGHGHLKSREPLTDITGKLDLEKFRIDAFRDKHLTVRTHSYINQVMNALHVEPQMDKLDRLARALGEDLSQAKPAGFGKIGVEAKAYSLLDLLRVYAHRMKDYPVKRGMVSEALIATQSMFFRSLVVRPWIWLRDFPQRWITVPHKEMVLDPRYYGKQFPKMPKDIQERYFSRGTDQEGAFRQDFLQLQATEKVKRIPIVRTFFNAAEKVGSFYEMLNSFSRKFVFSKTYMRSSDYINKFNNREIDLKTLEKRLGINKMEAPQQDIIRTYIQAGNVKEAAFEVADWMATNSQWAYRRTEKSLFEMTGEGESWTNLFTWSKGLSQQVIGSASKVKDGFDLMKMGKTEAGLNLMRSGAGTILGLYIAARVGNAALSTLSFTHKARYQSYGTDAFMWELGGATVDIVKDFTDTLSDLVTSFDGTPEEKKRATDAAVKLVDNMMIRQLIPFAKQTLAGIEAYTGRSYLSPVHEAFTKATRGMPTGQTYVQRNILESVAHGILATDPNKSEDVKKWAFKKLYEYQELAAKPGISQWYYQAQATRYKYLNDLFQRYTPYELYQDRVKKEWMKKFKEITDDEAMQKYFYRGQKELYELKRAKDVYR